MTEAQKCLYHIAENMRMAKSISKEGYEYFQQAIKALEQQPCEDCVSREQLNKLYNEYRPSLATRVCEFGERLKELPPVKPATVWHIVEEELPKEGGEYIVCHREYQEREYDVYTFNIEEQEWYNNEEIFEGRYENFIAWTELPEFKIENCM